MTVGDVAKYLTERVPRYTSYPTAPHFSPEISSTAYRAWLLALPERARLSLYLHIPFCRSLCWYCGCHTRIAGDRDPIDRYLETLEREIVLVADCLAVRRPVVHVHWGGGTPTIIGPAAFSRVMGLMRRRFDFEPGAEAAVEIDPRRLDSAMADALGAAGVTRASLGIQSFDSVVQRAVNRIQGFEQTRATAEAVRAAGVRGLNVDLLYGLPHQTEASCVETVAAALALTPDRVSVFGYAHMPALKRHQARFDPATLPGPEERFRQEQAIGAALVAAGYHRIGLDHYALPGDSLARAQAAGRLRRNFQGYTDDPADALLGFGASAIGELPQGYVQNAPEIKRWRERIAEGQFATVRGIALERDDRARRAVIERLMCDLSVDLAATLRRHEFAEGGLDDALSRLAPLAAEGLVRIAGRVITVPEESRPLLRRIAAAFDAYLDPAAGRHAVAV